MRKCKDFRFSIFSNFSESELTVIQNSDYNEQYFMLNRCKLYPINRPASCELIIPLEHNSNGMEYIRYNIYPFLLKYIFFWHILENITFPVQVLIDYWSIVRSPTSTRILYPSYSTNINERINVTNEEHIGKFNGMYFLLGFD